jgi:hypothetical protein
MNQRELKMKPLMMVGLILLVLGVAVLGYNGFALVTTRDTVAKAGPIEVKADQEHAIPLWPFGAVALVAGLGCMAASSGGRSGPTI